MNKVFELFRTPSASDLARAQMRDAEREYLKHISASEFHAKMAEYHKGVVIRLKQEAP